MYCPKNIDIPAYEGYLKSCIASERERYAIAIARAEAHKAGYEEGTAWLWRACAVPTTRKSWMMRATARVSIDFLYELGKELGIGSARPSGEKYQPG